MPQFILKIDLGNEEMKEGNDIAWTLRQIATDIQFLHDANRTLEKQRTIRDINGNVVGHYEVIP
jgi:hypothetical protein